MFDDEDLDKLMKKHNITNSDIQKEAGLSPHSYPLLAYFTKLDNESKHYCNIIMGIELTSLLLAITKDVDRSLHILDGIKLLISHADKELNNLEEPIIKTDKKIIKKTNKRGKTNGARRTDNTN